MDQEYIIGRILNFGNNLFRTNMASNSYQQPYLSSQTWYILEEAVRAFKSELCLGYVQEVIF